MGSHKKWKYCVVGNIVNERMDENGVFRHGTAAFKGGARVYLEGKNYNYERNDVTVIGMNRHWRYVYEYIPKDQIENVRFTKTYKPTIMNMMYEYEGRDGWWGNSDEDGLDARQFAANWPEIRETFGEDYLPWLCNERIREVFRMHAPGHDEDLMEDLDYQYGITYHATDGYWLVFETDKHIFSLGTDGLKIYGSEEEIQRNGNKLFHEMFNLESIVFAGERIRTVRDCAGGCKVEFTDFTLDVVYHTGEDHYEGKGPAAEVPFNGFDHVLRPCPCGGKPAFMMDRHGDYYVECRKCHRCGEAGYIPALIVRQWNEKRDDIIGLQ